MAWSKYEKGRGRNRLVGVLSFTKRQIGIASDLANTVGIKPGMQISVYYDTERPALAVAPDLHGVHKCWLAHGGHGIWFSCRRLFDAMGLPRPEGKLPGTIKDGMIVVELPAVQNDGEEAEDV